MMTDYTVVIATLNRPNSLAVVLDSLASQTIPPGRIVVVDASTTPATRDLCQARDRDGFPVEYRAAAARSAARQRNQGATDCQTSLIAFVDDDVELPPATFANMIRAFADADTGGVAGRIEGLAHPRPRGLLWLYYRLQAGYSHPHYGGRVIGAAINLLPCWSEEKSPLVPAEWLNSACVIYRRELFEREKFPAFEGYSFMEDAHLSFRVGRTHRLYFCGEAPYLHHEPPTTAAKDPLIRSRMIVRHQKLFARELMGLRGFSLAWKTVLHRIFQTVALARARPPRTARAILGLWL